MRDVSVATARRAALWTSKLKQRGRRRRWPPASSSGAQPTGGVAMALARINGIEL
jgi:hypothetical protein